MVKLTFSLDEDTVTALRKVADRTNKPQSQIVREAIAHYAAQEDTLTEAERERLLAVLRRIKARRPTRSAGEVDRELDAIRRARRTGWSRGVR